MNHRLLLWSLLGFEWWNRLIGQGRGNGAVADPVKERGVVQRGPAPKRGAQG